MDDSKFSVAIIGTGMIANAGHIPAIRNLPDDFEIVAVADADGARARQVAEKEKIPHAFDDWERMLADVKPDVVSVCTPNMYHRTHTIAALQSGAHVLCEKPIATSLADARAMYAAADEAKRVLYVCQSLRFYNNMIAAKEFASAGALGEIYFAEAVGMRRRGIPTWGQFHMKQHSGAGPVFDLGVHQFDGLLWLMGNPAVEAVSAQTFTKLGNRDEGLKTSLAESGAPLGVLTPRTYDFKEFDVEDMAAGMVRLEGGAVVTFRISWAANITRETFNTTVLGTAGGLTTDPFCLATNMGSYQVDVTPRLPADRDVHFSGHWVAVEQFLRVLRGQEEPVVKREEVLNVMALLDGIYESARLGEEIRLS